MKHIKTFLMTALCVFSFASCTQDMNYAPGGVTSVEKILQPADKYYVELQSLASTTLQFVWTPAIGEDGRPAHYELLFLKSPNGEVMYTYDGGMKSSISIPHKQINKIAGACGIATGDSGDVYWTVVSSRAGDRSPIKATSHCLSIQRLNGFEEIPTDLYLMGDGTDAGTKPLRCLEGGSDGGEYTVYVKLEAGQSYQFVSTIDENVTPRKFSIDSNDMLVESDTPSVVEKSGIYRLFLDFNTRAVVKAQIDKIQLFQCSQDKHFQNFVYQGRGLWTATGMVTNAGDNRYLFHTWTNGANNWNEKWASKNWDNPSAPTAGSPSTTWSLYVQTDRLNDAWGYSFKWIGSEWNSKKSVDIRIQMNLDNNDKPFFHHEVSYK